MFLTMYLAGLRVGECASLRYNNILDSHGNVMDQIILDTDQTKGRTGRVVFLGEKIRKELRHYVKTYPPVSDDQILFYSQKNPEQGFTPNTLCQFFHQLFRDCGLQGASSHSPRRTFITNLANRGVGVRVLQKLAGHQHISTTQHYIDVNDGQQKAAVELL